MNRTRYSPPLAAVYAVIAALLALVPALAGAVELRVPQDFASIQAALTAAVDGDTVAVEPGVYRETITLRNNVTLHGRETARTFLSSGSGPIVVANGPINATVRNFTFINASIGIRVTDNTSSLSINNNVFQLGAGGAALVIANAPLTKVVNNAFIQNGTAVSSDTNIEIINNIFMNNATAIAVLSGLPANIANNAFSGNSANGPTGANPVSGDPLFADPARQDFHLRENSPCIDTGSASVANDFDGTQSDIGAYGGPAADTAPFPVQGLTITQTTETSILFTWSPNNSYLVSNSLNLGGGYKVYYGYAPGVYNGTDAEGGTAPSPIEVGSDTEFELLDLAPIATESLSSPVLDQPSPRDGALALSWSGVPGAAGYKVHYGSLSKGENTIDVGGSTTYRLSGLTNGQSYHVAVSAYAPSTTYYIAVTAVDNTLVAHESAVSQEVPVAIGASKESGLSNECSEYPEPITIYPDLPNEHQGCFLATAAYGTYSAPEVMILRSFRDQYLLTNGYGRVFVEWYYRRGPALAALLNAHPGYKPAVRAALLPAVGLALFLTRTPAAVQAGALILIGLAVLLLPKALNRGGRGERRGNRLKITVLLLIMMLLPSIAPAAEPHRHQPRWSLEVKGGVFAPALENWEFFFDKKSMPEYAASLAYKLTRQVEVGAGAGSIRGTGMVYAPLHGSLVSSVEYQLYPVNAFVMLRGALSDEQWLVPYLGGGWTRMYYRETVQFEETKRGFADGYHVRGGLSFSLDALDPRATNNMYLIYGILRTSLFIEAEQTRAVVRSVSTDLGGMSYRGGLLLEF